MHIQTIFLSLTGLFIGLRLMAQPIEVETSPLKHPVVRIDAISENEPKSSGTGFIVGQKDDRLYLFTAFHVIKNGAEIELAFFDRSVRKAKIEDIFEKEDIAILSCEPPPAYKNLRSYKLSLTMPKLGDDIYIIGHPLDNTWSIINSKVNDPTKGISGEFSFSPASVKVGCSGGPILNKKFELIGMTLQVSATEAIGISSAKLQDALRHKNIPENLLKGILNTQPNNLTANLDNNFVLVRGGTFTMGSTEGETNERPPHPVKLNDFYLARHELTYQEFRGFVEESNYKSEAEQKGGSQVGKEFTNRNGVNWRHDANGNLREPDSYTHPVVHVSWNDAQAYCQWLSDKTGERYRLPSEAEWEYAAGGGAGTRNRWSGTDNETELTSYAWYNINGESRTHPVGEKRPNSLGLYDMSGNVVEWCQDDFRYYSASDVPEDGSPWVKSTPDFSNNKSIKAVRDGGWYNEAGRCRTTYRFPFEAQNTNGLVGFRILREVRE